MDRTLTYTQTLKLSFFIICNEKIVNYVMRMGSGKSQIREQKSEIKTKIISRMVILIEMPYAKKMRFVFQLIFLPAFEPARLN